MANGTCTRCVHNWGFVAIVYFSMTLTLSSEMFVEAAAFFAHILPRRWPLILTLRLEAINRFTHASVVKVFVFDIILQLSDYKRF